ncbi:MAG: hypothetical protein ACX94C_06060 [Phycisphaerales bacterium]
MIKRSTMTGAMLTLLLAGACAAAPDQEPKREQAEKESKLRQSEEKELVEITIRLPDGRVIKRKEPRIASKVETDVPPLTSSAPTAAKRGAQSNKSKGVTVTKRGVTGGTNSSTVNTTGGSGGGGGGGGSGGGSGGGGGGGDTGNGNSAPPPPGGGGHSGGSSSDEIVPVQPDTDFTVRMYAWDNSGSPFSHIQEAVVVDPRGVTPEHLVRRVSRQIRASNHDKVVLRFWQELSPADRYPFDISSPRELVSSGGFSSGLYEYWGEFARLLHAEGITPDYLIFDLEKGIRFWQIPVGQRRDFFAELLDQSRPLTAGLPVSMRGVRLEDFMNDNAAGRQARDDYSQFAYDLRANLLRRVFVKTFNDQYGTEIHASNFWDIIPSDPVYRYYDTEQTAATIAGISAPVSYLDDYPTSKRYGPAQKHPRWNRLIDAINRVRSTAQPGLTTPWIAPPGYGRNGPDTWARSNELEEENWIWDAKMQHLLAMGVDTFILWNPSPRFNPNAVVTDNWMEDWLSRHQRVTTPQLRDLPQIPIDADVIETNGYVTTYEDFLQNMNITDTD